MMNGQTDLTISSKLTFAILHPTYKQLPTGGVIIPIPIFTIKIIPTRYGLTPTAVRIGSKMGVSRAIAALELRKQPAIRTMIYWKR